MLNETIRDVSPKSDAVNASLRLFEVFQNGEYRSSKHDSYFQVYEEILGPYVDQEITFVEVGVLGGGSLFMWRDYLGPKARIIGIDLNPAAKQWEEHGFEIFIGDQSQLEFWREFYDIIGPVDILVDDGGHTNSQQIVTTHAAIPNIREGGLIIVEDVHASYLSEFGNPSKYSFVNFARFLVDCINSRFPRIDIARGTYSERVFSVTFYESIVVLKIAPRSCFVSSPIANAGVFPDVADFRYVGKVQGRVIRLRDRLRHQLVHTVRLPFLKNVGRRVLSAYLYLTAMVENRKLKKYFEG